MKIIQSVPNYVEATAKTEHFKTIDELKKIKWVKTRMKQINGIPFFRLSLSNRFKGEYILMAEHKNNDQHKWWPIGYMEGDIDLLGLPAFKT